MTGALKRVKIKGYRRVPVWADSDDPPYGFHDTAMGILEIDGSLYTPRGYRRATPKTRATKLDTQPNTRDTELDTQHKS